MTSYNLLIPNHSRNCGADSVVECECYYTYTVNILIEWHKKLNSYQIRIDTGLIFFISPAH